MPIKYLYPFVFFLLLQGSLLGQDTLRGRVYAMDGQPLSGASVRLLKGGETLSGPAGAFLLPIRQTLPDSLIVSHIGYTGARVFVTGSTATLNITLSPSGTEMEEVVVSTGFQRISKERLTGSVVTIDNALINRSVGMGILDRLDGVTPGLLFDKRNPDNPRLQIRGLFTLTEGISQPLIVVDNFPYEGDINELNPNDVENVSILRDAAAASIWGARAGNGVIVITTKKGGFNQKARVSLSAATTVKGKPDLFSLPVLGSGAVVDLERELFNKGAYDAVENDLFSPLTPLQELLFAHRRGALDEAALEAGLNELKGQDVRADFLRYVYQPEIRQQYSLGISGGSGGVKYQVSGGHDRNREALQGSGNQRTSFRSSLTVQPTKNFSVETSINYAYLREQRQTAGGYDGTGYRLGSRSFPVYGRLAGEDGEPLAIPFNYQLGYTDTAGGGKLLEWSYRPLRISDHPLQSESTASLTGNLGLRYQPLPGLQAELRYQYQQINKELNILYGEDSYFARNLVNLYTQITPSGNRYGVPQGGMLDQLPGNAISHQGRAQLSYQRNWNKLHALDVMAAGEIRQRRSGGGYYRSYGYQETLGNSRLDYLSLYPRYTGGSSTVPFINSHSAGLDRFVGVLGNASYTYDGRYTLYGSARRDASNLFGVATNRQGSPFWSTGGRWNVSREGFYSVGWLPELSLSTSYGSAGNVNNLATAYATITYGSASTNTVPLPFARMMNAPNPTLRWEKVRTWNIEARFSGKGGFFSGSLAYYRKRSIDVYGSQPLDPSTGFSIVEANSAHIGGSGLDLTLALRTATGKPFDYNAQIAVSHARYELERYLIPYFSQGYTSDGSIVVPLVGQNPYLVVSHPWAGLAPETGDPLGLLKGTPSTDYPQLLQNPLEEQVLHGPGLPPWFGNLLQQVRWKGWSVSANITYGFGHYFRKSASAGGDLRDRGIAHSELADRWRAPGDEAFTHVPSLYSALDSYERDMFYQQSAVHVRKAGFIRLDDVRLSYDHRVNKAGASLRLFAIASSLRRFLYLANGEGIDPENPNGIPVPAQFSGGIQLHF